MSLLDHILSFAVLALASCVAFALLLRDSKKVEASAEKEISPLGLGIVDQLTWVVRLRWVVAVVVLSLSLLAVFVLEVLPVSSLLPLLFWIAVLTTSNAVLARSAGDAQELERRLSRHLALDFVVVTGLLSASGGVENPLYLSYVFPTIVGATLLSARKAFLLTLFGCALFCLLAAGEATGLLPHVTFDLFPHETSMSPGHAAHQPAFVAGKTASLLVLMLVSFYLTALLTSRLRASEARAFQAANEAVMEHERLERLVDAAGLGMLVVDPEVTLSWRSRRAEKWVGGSELAGETCPLLAAKGGCSVCVAQLTFETGEPSEVERTVSGATTRVFRHLAEPLLDETGRCVQVVEVMEEITERKTLEADALRAGKLALLGQLAAGIAHEIGNPLASLMARLNRLERRRDDQFVHESLDVLKAQVERIDRTIKNVSGFSRMPPADWRACSLNAIIAEALGLVRYDERGLKVEIEDDLAEPSATVWAVRDQIVQAVLNLLLNAVEATPDGGRVSVTSSVSGGNAVIEVRDSGSGVPLELQEQIFDPFVTTKESGVGLGLAISRSLVHGHGGSLEVETLPAGGSCFRIILPLEGSGVQHTSEVMP